MRDRSRYGSSIAFLDFLFNLVLTFVVIAILLLVIMKTETAKPSVENKSDFVVMIEWDNDTADDVDLWVKDPADQVVGFPNKEQPGMHLQRDDVGLLGEQVLNVDNELKGELKNVEIVNITAWQKGTYSVNLHLYKSDKRAGHSTGEITVTIRVMKVNPFYELAPVTVKLDRTAHEGNELPILNFTVSDKGMIESADRLPIYFVTEWRHTARPTSEGVQQ